MTNARALLWTAPVLSFALLAASAHLAHGQPASAPTPATSPASATQVVRIKAGLEKPLTDKAGNVWQADTGFVDGETIERPDIKITGTDTPQLFQSERYDMTAFKHALPNGKYTVKLYLSETYEEVKAAGERVFTINVEGEDLKDFDPFKEAGGANKAIIKTFEVDIKDDKLDITFTAKAQAPAINAIEIIPKP